MVRDHSYKTYGISLEILGYSETRWNSLQMLFASLLRIRTALSTFAADHLFDDGFPNSLTECTDIHFWRNLEIIEKMVRPLAAASFTMEKNNVTMAQCTHIYMVLFATFSHDPTATEEIEKRWNNLEQPLFLLTYLLHPRFAHTAREMLHKIKNPAGKIFYDESRILLTAQFYYKRLISTDSERVKCFTNEINTYVQHERLFTRITGQTEDEWLSYWQAHCRCYPELTIFSIFLLSVTVQSATCERIFQVFHTGLRNGKANKIDI